MPVVEQSERADDDRPGGTDASGAQASQWPRVKALFLDALQLSIAERRAFLERATSGDVALRREVESLLSSDEAAGSFCETPAAGLLGGFSAASDAAAQLPVGTRFGAYEITGFIAAGGMGAVYRAKHTVLRRDVAIKTVSPGFADQAAKRRLIREARHVSSLTHPNICAIYDVGEADELPFIVMELVDGKSLGEIVRAGLPPLDRVLDYAMQIVAALDHAHRHGIVHRDLKGSNVVIDRSGRAIVLDFGLARRDVGAGHGADSTETHRDALAGTLSHMAPELLRGERADPRSDIWALGVLLFQLVSGDLPFPGRTPFETSSAILTESPATLSRRAPLALRLIIERCLNKDPHGRFQTAHEVGVALDAVRRRRAWPVIGRIIISARRRTLYAAAAALCGIAALTALATRVRGVLGVSHASRLTTVALLPLASATGDEGTLYYRDGVTDALIAQLGATSDIRVLSRSSSARAAASGRPLREIGNALGADLIAQGTLRRSGEQISIALRLIRPSDERVVWSDSVARNAREILALQSELVRGLADALQAGLRPGASERLSMVRAVSPEVYESYLEGRYEWNQRTPQSLTRAIEYFSRSIQLDPTYAPAHAALADCYNQLGTVLVGSGSPREFRPRAEAEAIKALQIDQSSAEAHAALGYVNHYELRWADAEREFRKAIELNPSFALARIWYANMLMSKRRGREAIEQVNAARELDPFSSIINSNVGWILDEAGRHEDAIVQLRKTLALDSTYVQARMRLAGALLSAGHLDQARTETHRLLAATDSGPSVLALLALIEARGGQPDSARAILRRLEALSATRYVPPVSIAHVQIALGNFDDAMKSLEIAFDEGSNAIAYLDVADLFDPIRRDRRFERLRSRAGFE
jgi:serine/threonine-protein kinase